MHRAECEERHFPKFGGKQMATGYQKKHIHLMCCMFVKTIKASPICVCVFLFHPEPQPQKQICTNTWPQTAVNSPLRFLFPKVIRNNLVVMEQALTSKTFNNVFM